MLAIAENLHAEIRKIECHEVDPTLIPVEQPNATVARDPNVAAARISMDDRNLRVSERDERLKNVIDDIAGEQGEVGVHAASRAVEFDHRPTPGPLPTPDEGPVEPAELRCHQHPVRDRVRFTTVDPTLHDNAVGAGQACVGQHGGRDEEAGFGEVEQQLELPRE